MPGGRNDARINSPIDKERVKQSGKRLLVLKPVTLWGGVDATVVSEDEEELHKVIRAALDSSPLERVIVRRVPAQDG